MGVGVRSRLPRACQYRLGGPELFTVLVVAAGMLGLPSAFVPSAAASTLSPVASHAAPPTMATVDCAGTDCGPVPTGAGSVALRGVHPEVLGNTPSNWLVANWSGEGMIAENPSNPLNLVAGSLYQALSALNNTTIYNNQGVSGVYTSFDGGQYWAVQPLPACEFHIADTAVAFGPDNHAYYIDMGWTTGQQGCTYSTSGYGVFVTPSTDGGMTWGTPVPVRGNATTSLDKPWAAADPTTGEVYVAYTDDASGSQIYIQNSTDNGTHWSTALDISRGTDSMRGVELAIDGSGAIDAAWVDQSTAQIEFCRSVNHGHSFSTPKVAGVAPTAFASPSPDGFRAYLLPALGLDAYAGNAYAGRLFLTWQNGSGAAKGSPFVSLIYSDDNGTNWSKPITVNSDRTLEDFQPSVAVDAAGTVYVVWYGENGTSGHYRLLGAASHDGGTTFDPEFPVSDTDSYPSYPGFGNAWWIGDYTSIIADAAGAHPLWTDARATQEWSCNPCLWGYDYNISMYTAQIVNYTLASNVPVNLSISGTVPANASWPVGPQPRSADWLAGQVFNLSAPAILSVNGTSLYFAAWYGAINSTSANVSGVVAGGGRLNACYVPTFGGVCRAAEAPGFLGIRVSPPNATVRVDGRAVGLVAGQANVSASVGSHWVNVSAPGFHSLSVLAQVTTANLTPVYANLTPYPGLLTGSVEPADARVTIDGSAAVVAPNGSFSSILLPGQHAVVATLALYSSFIENVSIGTNATTSVTIRLSAQWGILSGSVTPATASLTVNGQTIPTTNGTFRAQLAPGIYWVNASLAGYVDGTSGPVGVSLLATTTVSLALLRAFGTLQGSLSPAWADLQLNGSEVAIDSGNFTITALPGQYWLNASALGYNPSAQWVTVNAESVTQATVLLTASPGWIVGTVNPQVATVSVDGDRIPVAADGSFNISVSAGMHHLSASAQGRTPYVATVRVLAGYSTQVRLALSAASAPAGSSALLPTGVGIAAVAVAAAVFLLVRRRRRSGPARGARQAGPVARRR